MATPTTCRLSGGPFDRQTVRVLPTRNQLLHVEWKPHKPGRHTLADGCVYVGTSSTNGKPPALHYKGTLEDMRR